MKKEDLEKMKLHVTLRDWCLPMMARAIEADEKEREALEFLNKVQRMAEIQKAKAATK